MKKTMELIEHYFKDHKTWFSENTVKVYRISLKHFFDFVGKPYDEVKKADIRKWLEYFNKKGLSIGTKNLRLTSVRLFFRYAFEEGLIDRDPSANIKTARKEKTIPRCLNQRQLIELFEVTKDSVRDRTLVEMLYATGTRISELLEIKISDIKWDGKLAWIRKGKGNKERFVLFTTECGARLREYLKTRTDKSPYIFTNGRGGHLSAAWVQTIFRRYSEKLGFKVTPHMLRHSMASHLADKDMPIAYIQELLGHKNVNTTRIYAQLSSEKRKQQYDSYQ